MRLTMKFKIRTDKQSVLRETIRQYTDSYNRVCAIGWKKKRISGVELHHDTYTNERSITDLPSQLVISARAGAMESLLAARALQKKGCKVSCPTSLSCPVRYDERSANIKLQEGYATLASIDGRVRVELLIKKHHKHLNWKICSSELRENKKGFWLYVVVEM